MDNMGPVKSLIQLYGVKFGVAYIVYNAWTAKYEWLAKRAT